MSRAGPRSAIFPGVNERGKEYGLTFCALPVPVRASGFSPARERAIPPARTRKAPLTPYCIIPFARLDASVSDEGATRFQVLLPSATSMVISKTCLPWVNRGYCSFALIWFHRTGSDFPPPEKRQVPVNPTPFKAEVGMDSRCSSFVSAWKRSNARSTHLAESGKKQPSTSSSPIFFYPGSCRSSRSLFSRGPSPGRSTRPGSASTNASQ